jgi:hypothetical protein
MIDILPSVEGLLLHPQQRDRFRLPTLNLLWGGEGKKSDTQPRLILQHENIVNVPHSFTKGARWECLTLKESTVNKRELAWHPTSVSTGWFRWERESFFNEEIAKMVTKFPTKHTTCTDTCTRSIPLTICRDIDDKCGHRVVGEDLGDPGVDGRLILRWIFRKWDVGVWTGSSSTGGGHLWMR